MNPTRYASLFLLLLPLHAATAAVGPDAPTVTAPIGLLPAWSFQGNQHDARLGTSVCIAGDVNGDGFSDVLASAPKASHPESSEGIVYVFHGSPQGPSLAPSWSAESNLSDSQFGDAVAAAGDVNGDGYGDVIVGAPQLGNGENHEGRAYVYLGSATGLAAAPAWTYESNQAGAWLGIAVAAAGDVDGDGYGDVIVGASNAGARPTGEGAAYVFRGSAGGLEAAPSWTLTNAQVGSRFGEAVCTAGDVNGDGFSDVIVGAKYFTNGQAQEGAAYAYHGSASGLVLAPAWIAEADQVQAFLGTSLCTAGDVNGDGYSDVIVGANQWDNGFFENGRALVYHGGPGGLAANASWFHDGTEHGTFYGSSVSTAGDVNDDGYADVIVGGYRHLDFTGVAQVFLGSPGGLAAAPDWEQLGGPGSTQYGCSVGTAGDVNGDGYTEIVVGALWVSDPEVREGAAYVYLGQARGMSTPPQSALVVDDVDGTIGVVTGSAGDVNGDGFSDLFVGLRDARNAALERVGRVDVYYGSPAGCSSAPDWSAEGSPGSLGFGVSAASAGDVNGDGYSDLIVGQELGGVHVFYGSSAGLGAAAAWTATGEQNSDLFGYSTACAGDVNGDGYSDVVVGASSFGRFHNDYCGAAYLWYGSAAGLGDPATAAEADWRIEGTDEVQFMGGAVGSAGDVNGDGFSDLLVAASCHYHFGGPLCSQAGNVSIYLGSAQGLDSIPDWSAVGDDQYAALDLPAGAAGDVNGDGYVDVFAKSHGEEGPSEAILIWYGSVQGLGDPGTLANADARLTSDQTGDGFGERVACAGDVNGDGCADLLVGAPRYDIGGAGDSDGRAFLFRGSPSGLQNPPDWFTGSFGVDQLIGRSLGGAGDVNGDGFADIAIVDRGDLATFVNAHIWLGEQGGPTRCPRQLRTDGVTPIAPLGLTDATMNAGFSAYARSAFGRTRAKLEWEVKPLGILLDGTGTKRSLNWQDTDIDGSRIATLDDQLPAPSVQHWRARLHFDPAQTPFAAPSRWFSAPLNGWNEADYRRWPAPTAVESPPGGLRSAGLALRAAPNPLRPGGRISFELPRRARVELSLHDVTGARRMRLDGGRLEPGTHQFAWSGRDDSGRLLASGVYFVRVLVNGQTASQGKVVVLK